MAKIEEMKASARERGEVKNETLDVMCSRTRTPRRWRPDQIERRGNTDKMVKRAIEIFCKRLVLDN